MKNCKFVAEFGHDCNCSVEINHIIMAKFRCATDQVCDKELLHRPANEKQRW